MVSQSNGIELHTEMSIIALSLSCACMLSGLCGVIGALVDWDFYDSEYARRWLIQFGRSGTRVMIGFAGAISLVVGILGALWALGS